MTALDREKLIESLYQDCFFDSSHPRTRAGVVAAILRTLTLVAEKPAVAEEVLELWKKKLPPQ